MIKIISRVQTNWGITCTPTARTTATYSTTKSNTKASATTGIENQQFTEGVNLYPNPTNSEFNLEFSSGYKTYHIAIFNLLGDVVYLKDVSGASTGNTKFVERIDVSAFAVGIYTVSIQTETVKVFKKLAVQ